MRFRRFISLVGLVALSLFALMVIGCSDDDPVTPSGHGDVTVADSIDNPQFVAVNNQVEDLAESIIDLSSDGMSMTTMSIVVIEDIVFGSLPPDSSSIDADWRVYFLLQAGAQVYGLDSIRFMKDGASTGTGIGADEVRYKHYYRVNMDDTTVTFVNSSVHGDLTMTGLDGAIANITGTYDFGVESKYVSVDSTVWQDFDIQSTVTSLSVDRSATGWNRGCPSSGTVSVTVSASYKKDSQAAVETDWEFDLTFDDGLMEVEARLGTDSAWYSLQLCTVE